MESAAIALKKLRQNANPRVTVRAMAQALEMPLSSYSRYENPDDFKRRHLPLDLARKIAAILADNGVEPLDVLRLAGVEAVEARCLSALQERLLSAFDALDHDRKHIALHAVEAMVPPKKS